MARSIDTEKSRACAVFLGEPGERVVVEMCDEIDALRAEVAKYRGMEVESAGLRTDNEALRSEVAALKAMYAGPLTQGQVERAHEIFTGNNCLGNWQERDAAIRAAREGR